MNLIKELTIAISVLYNAKRLFIIHFMFLNLLNFVLFILVKNVPFELQFVLHYSINVVHPIMKKRRNEFLKVSDMHKVRIDTFQHLLVKIKLKCVFILLS